MSIWNPNDFKFARRQMVHKQLEARGINDPKVIEAMSSIPRHLFVDEALANKAYGDHPLPIGDGQTISQPYIVGMMTQSLELKKSDRVLEIGAGCGYQTAILASLVKKIYALERIPSLVDKAVNVLAKLNIGNVILKLADGTLGWPEEAPFDAILVAAGSPKVPQPLLDQLKVGGRLLVPVGATKGEQKMIKVVKELDGSLSRSVLGACRFVDLIGQHGW